MRRSSGVSLVLVAVVLAGCAGKRTVLPPAEVLRRAAVRSRSLESARYTLAARGDIAAPGALWKPVLAMEGVLRDGGAIVQGTVTVTGSVQRLAEAVAYRGQAEFFATSPADLYVRLLSVSVTPPEALPSTAMLQTIQGAWWKLPPSDAPSATRRPALSPDPRLLRLQADVVSVTEDLGLETIHDRDAYHYRVDIDPDKLRQFLRAVGSESGERSSSAALAELLSRYVASGELWIDADSFYLHRIQWTVVDHGDRDNRAARSRAADFALVGTGTLIIELRDHDRAPATQPPADFRVLGSGLLLRDAFSSRSASGATL